MLFFYRSSKKVLMVFVSNEWNWWFFGMWWFLESIVKSGGFLKVRKSDKKDCKVIMEVVMFVI